MNELLVFALADREYGVDVTCVREIDRLVPITPVPRAPAYVEGVVNLHGQLIPVVNLCARLAIAQTPATKASRIVVAEVNARRVGMLVDAVTEVVRVPIERIEKRDGAFTAGIAQLDERPIALLDVSKVLALHDAKENA